MEATSPWAASVQNPHTATSCLSAVIPAQGSRSHPGKMADTGTGGPGAWVASVSLFRQSPTVPLGGRMMAGNAGHCPFSKGLQWRELVAKGGGQNSRPRRATEAHRLVCQLASLQACLTNRTPHKQSFPRPDVASGPPEQSACQTGGPWDEPPRSPEPSGNFTQSTLSVCSLVWPHTHLLLTASTKSCSVPSLTPRPCSGPAQSESTFRTRPLDA